LKIYQKNEFYGIFIYNVLDVKTLYINEHGFFFSKWTLNKMNKLVEKKDIENILNKLGNIGDNEKFLEINSLDIYQTAFVHKSYLNEEYDLCDINGNLFIPKSSYEVLEFNGDSFLGAVIANYLCLRFPEEQEGFLTKMRTRLVRSSMLYRFARFLGLGEYILLSRQVENLTRFGSNKGRNNPKLYEDCFEALIGAIIKDFGDEHGYKIAKRFILNIIEYIIDFQELVLCNENHKDTLQRFFQSQNKIANEKGLFPWSNPTYQEIQNTGPSHMKLFIKGIFLPKKNCLQLNPKIQESIHKHSFGIIDGVSFDTSTRNYIKNYTQENDSFIIGIGCANKKCIAEQLASNIALITLHIDPLY
jgi:dsRNA-specific ribonuclease